MLQTFPLGYIWGHYMDLQWHIGRLQAGSIVALQVSATGIIGLRDAAADLQLLGSVLSAHLTPSSHWVWIFVKGGRTILETAVPQKQTSVSVHGSLSFAPSVNRTFINDLEKERWEYCQTQEAMGPYCDEENPDPVRPESRSLPYTDVLDNIPVFVTGGNRPQYLYVALQSLINAPGMRRQNLEVLIGDTSDSVLTLLKLMDVKYVRIQVYGEQNSKLFQYYRATYQYAADKHQASPAAIYLDEDVEVSPDFFSVMSQMIPLLAIDPTLYCATAHAGGSSPQLYGNKDKLKRATSQVLWGYALTMMFINEALQKWPTNRKYNVLYDMWLNDNVAAPRECVYPEVSRTKHFGAGMNTQGYDLERFFLSVDLTKEVGIRITNLQDIPLKNWMALMLREIKKATVLVGNPCEPGFFHNRPNGTYIFYYSLIEDDDKLYRIDNYFRIGECLQFWALSDQGWHDALNLLRIKPGVDLYLMGVPLSSYSDFMKPGYTPWSISNLTKEESRLVIEQSSSYFTVRQNIIEYKTKHPTYAQELFAT